MHAQAFVQACRVQGGSTPKLFSGRGVFVFCVGNPLISAGTKRWKTSQPQKQTIKAESDTVEYANINSLQTDDFSTYTPRGPRVFKATFSMEEHVQAAWRHWEALGNPRWIMAPMVDQSELAFRMMGRKYNCDLCYTPMLHSRMFVTNRQYRKDYLQTLEKDRPLVVQFCANNPNTLLEAAKYVEDVCDAVDLNLGCPQEIARRGKYGSFLMEEWDRIHDLILTLKQNLKVPVWAKIRLFPEISRTVEYAKMIEAAGASAIAIHGRTRKQKGNNPGPADLDAIREVARELRVPVIANGNVRTFEEAQECLRRTECHAVMSACGLLVNPNLFSGAGRRWRKREGTYPRPGAFMEPVELAKEYINFADRFSAHPRQILVPQIQHRTDLLTELSHTKIRPKETAAQTFFPFLEKVCRETGTLKEARAEQEVFESTPVGLDEEAEDEFMQELQGRSLNKAQYRAALRKQRRETKKRSQIVISGLSVQKGSSQQAALSDPFAYLSCFYHRLPEDDLYGERTLEDLTAAARLDEGRNVFLVRRSNSDRCCAVSLTFRDGIEIFHRKIKREEEGEKEVWRMESFDSKQDFWEDSSLNNLLQKLVEMGYYGLRNDLTQPELTS